MDLQCLMSAEMALEFHQKSRGTRCICEAPLVEGAIAAAVEAAAGSDIEQVWLRHEVR